MPDYDPDDGIGAAIAHRYRRDLQTLHRAIFSDLDTATLRRVIDAGGQVPGVSVNSLVNRHARLTVLLSTGQTATSSPSRAWVKTIGTSSSPWLRPATSSTPA